MKYSAELKVGIALVLSFVMIVLGIRFFEDVPLFRGSYALTAVFDDAEGLTSGSAVMVSGVNVGNVRSVALDPETQGVLVRFQVDRGVRLTEGTVAQIAGISALGGVKMELVPGPLGGRVLQDGAVIPAGTQTDIISELTSRGPVLAARLDTLMLGAALTLGEAYTLLGSPDSDLRLSLAGLRQTTNALNALIRAESGRLSQVLANADAFTSDLRVFTAQNRDSLTLAVSGINASLRRLDRNLATIEGSTATLDSILAKVNRPEGNLGLLLNDSTLYVRLDTSLRRVNGLLDDFQRDPARYLRHMTLVRVF